MTRWSAITRTRGRRSALAYGSRSATAAQDNLNGSYTTNGDATAAPVPASPRANNACHTRSPSVTISRDLCGQDVREPHSHQPSLPSPARRSREGRYSGAATPTIQRPPEFWRQADGCRYLIVRVLQLPYSAGAAVEASQRLSYNPGTPFPSKELRNSYDTSGTGRPRP
jgi:hypothetical protein